jgi:hypothetical protein
MGWDLRYLNKVIMDVRNNDANLDSQFTWTHSKCYTDRVLSLSLSLKGPVMNYDRLWLLGQNVWPMRWMALNNPHSKLFRISWWWMRWGWELLTCTLFWMWYTFMAPTCRVWVDVLFEQHSTLAQIVAVTQQRFLSRLIHHASPNLVTSSWTRKSCQKVPHW